MAVGGAVLAALRPPHVRRTTGRRCPEVSRGKLARSRARAAARSAAAVFIQRLFSSYLPPIWGWATLVWMRKREYL